MVWMNAFSMAQFHPKILQLWMFAYCDCAHLHLYATHVDRMASSARDHLHMDVCAAARAQHLIVRIALIKVFFTRLVRVVDAQCALLAAAAVPPAKKSAIKNCQC